MPTIILNLDSSGAVLGLKQYEAESKKAGRATRSLSSKISKFKTILSIASGVVSTVSASAFAVFTKKAIMAAGSMEDIQGKFNAVFKDTAADAERWSTTLSKSFDLAKKDTKEYMADLADIYQPMGMATRASAELSVQTVKLGADMSAFSGREVSEVINDLKVAMTGSYEVMKKYGVVLTVNKVKQEAVRLGLAKTVKTVSDAARVQAAYSLILKGSANSLGAHAREQASWNGQLKKASKILSDFMVKIGQRLLPAATRYLAVLNEWASNQDGINHLLLAAVSTIQFLVDGFNGLRLVVGAVMTAFALLVDFTIKGLSSILKPISLVFDSLVQLNLISFNPLKEALDEAAGAAEKFKNYSVKSLSDTWDGTVKATNGFERLKNEIESATKKQKEFAKASKEANAGIADGTATGIKGNKDLGAAVDTVKGKENEYADAIKRKNERNQKFFDEEERAFREQEQAMSSAISGMLEYANAIGGADDKLAAFSATMQDAAQAMAEGDFTIAQGTNMLNGMMAQTAEAAKKAREEHKKATDKASEGIREATGEQDKWNESIKKGVNGYKRLGDAAEKASKWGTTAYGNTKIPDYLNENDAKRYEKYLADELARMMRDANTDVTMGGHLSGEYGMRDPHTFISGSAYQAPGEAPVAAGGGGTVNVNINQQVSKSDIPDIIHGIEMVQARA